MSEPALPPEWSDALRTYARIWLAIDSQARPDPSSLWWHLDRAWHKLTDADIEAFEGWLAERMLRQQEAGSPLS